MPYRRLPNTDKARYRALETAFESVAAEKEEIPITVSTQNHLKSFFPKFKTTIFQLETAKENQGAKRVGYEDLHRKARLYVSHFMQVLNFSILRGEIKPEVREFYNISEKLPAIKSEKDIIKWGKRVIEGEQKRLSQGGNPIYNPSIALVRVNYEKFNDAYLSKLPLQKAVDWATKQLNDIREEADQLILDIWNETEQFYNQHSPEDKRKLSEVYGVTYVFRKKELDRLRAQSVQGKLNF